MLCARRNVFFWGNEVANMENMQQAQRRIYAYNAREKAPRDGSYREIVARPQKVVVEICDKIVLLTALRAAPRSSSS